MKSNPLVGERCYVEIDGATAPGIVCKVHEDKTVNIRAFADSSGPPVWLQNVGQADWSYAEQPWHGPEAD
jgi:hypothetical protein